jgi:hypothetical protein
VSLLLLALMIAASCNRDDIRYGVTYQTAPDGHSVISAAALMPQCMCMTLRNRRSSPTLVVASYYDQEIGKLLLGTGELATHRVRFDWAGPSNEETYELTAYPVEESGGVQRRGTEPLSPIREAVDVVGRPVASSCDERVSCEFGTLNMQRAFSAQLAAEEGTVTRRGVDFAHAGLTLEARAEGAGQLNCGCMVLWNSSMTDVMLRARHHGTEIGSLALPAGAVEQLAFDAAGPLPGDAYSISATLIQPMEPTAAAGPAEAGGALDTPNQVTELSAVTANDARIQDYVSILGQMNYMACRQDFSGADLTMASRSEGRPFGCPFGALRMNQFITPASAPQQAGASAGTIPGGAPPRPNGGAGNGQRR